MPFWHVHRDGHPDGECEIAGRAVGHRPNGTRPTSTGPLCYLPRPFAVLRAGRFALLAAAARSAAELQATRFSQKRVDRRRVARDGSRAGLMPPALRLLAGREDAIHRGDLGNVCRFCKRGRSPDLYYIAGRATILKKSSVWSSAHCRAILESF